METISKKQAISFWNDLKGTFHLSKESTSGIMSVDHIAEGMGISADDAERFLRRCTQDDLQLTERQGGGWVV